MDRLIDIRNITLKDVVSTGGPLPAGLIRCNETNRCKDITFDNVQATSWWDDMGWSWITEYADGSATDVVPNMSLNKASDQVFTLYSSKHALTAYE